jgi:hypothetical protein
MNSLSACLARDHFDDQLSERLSPNEVVPALPNRERDREVIEEIEEIHGKLSS